MHRLFLLTFLAGFFFQSQTIAQRTCHAHEMLQQEIQQDPDRLIRLEQIEQHTQRFIQSRQGDQRSSVVLIPIVVHVVYKEAVENISDAQILSQIDVLNDDFRRFNEDRVNTPADFLPVAADTQIEFCLATVDPLGNPTNGITRTLTTRTSFGTNNDVKFNSSGGKDAWPASDYFNVWVCVIGGNILGYAQFPGGNPATDGVVCDYRYFGTIGTATPPFHLGRTMTHEAGHYFNLRHIWGDGPCNWDDGVDDTPAAGGPNYTDHPCSYPGPNSCRPKGKAGQNDLPDMFQNYMDYSDDVCMNLFTDGQTTRMQAVLSPGGARYSLLSSPGAPDCMPTDPPAVEICDNNIDDDGDGDVDCADADCANAPNCAPSGSCDAPTNLSSVPEGKTNGRKVKAILSWSAANGAIDYTVQLRQPGGSWSTKTTTATSTSFGGLDNGVLYEWQVTSNCPDNQSATSAPPAEFIAGQSSSRQQQPVADLSAYPNPARSIVQVDLRQLQIEDMGMVQLTDITGRSLKQLRIDITIPWVEFNVSDLPNGLYLVRVMDRKGSTRAATKLLIQR